MMCQIQKHTKIHKYSARDKTVDIFISQPGIISHMQFCSVQIQPTISTNINICVLQHYIFQPLCFLNYLTQHLPQEESEYLNRVVRNLNTSHIYLGTFGQSAKTVLSLNFGLKQSLKKDSTIQRTQLNLNSTPCTKMFLWKKFINNFWK